VRSPLYHEFTKWLALILLAVVVGVILVSLGGCTVPVSVRPETDDKGKQIPALVAIEPREDKAGNPIPVPVAQTQPPPLAQNPAFAPVEAKPNPVPVPPSTDWLSILTTALGVLAGGAGGWVVLAQRTIATLKVAVAETADHGDRMEEAETDEDVKRVKKESIKRQKRLGVKGVIADIRVKPEKADE
jgi:hypothetical protein